MYHQVNCASTNCNSLDDLMTRYTLCRYIWMTYVIGVSKLWSTEELVRTSLCLTLIPRRTFEADCLLYSLVGILACLACMYSSTPVGITSFYASQTPSFVYGSYSDVNFEIVKSLPVCCRLCVEGFHLYRLGESIVLGDRLHLVSHCIRRTSIVAWCLP